MNRRTFAACALPALAALLLAPPPTPAEPPAVAAVFARPNLVAWCVVPFDARKRAPEERAAMLKRLGFTRFAYDWRAEHLPTFERELAALKANGIELTAVWFPATLNRDALALLDALKKHGVKTRLWVTTNGGAISATPAEQAKRVADTASALRPVAEAAAQIGCTVALYNHGGWFGEPENQLAVIEALKPQTVGIVYNLHHGHDHLARFPALLKQMMPHLVALNLNGTTPGGDQTGRKILPLGRGDANLGLLREVVAGGYAGPIGILGHTDDDAEERLRDNLDGLDWLLPQLAGAPAGPLPKLRTPVPAPAPAQPPGAPPAPPVKLEDWTPRAATGKAEPWEKAGEPEWVDARFRLTDTGPFFDATLDYPLGGGKQRVYKATAVRLGDGGGAGEGGVVFDRASMRLAAGWAGGYLNHSDRRYGLMNTPTPRGEMVFASGAGPGWAGPDGKFDAGDSGATIPLPKEWARYRGLHVNGSRVTFSYSVGTAEVLETPSLEAVGGVQCVVRTLRVGPSDKPLTLMAGRLPNAGDVDARILGVQSLTAPLLGKGFASITATADPATARLPHDGPEVRLAFPPSQAARLVRLIYAKFEREPAASDLPREADPADLTKPGPARWGKPLVTRLERNAAGGTASFAIDTLAIPTDNPFKALFFCTGVDFLPDGRVAVCTAHGDVWLVNVDETAGTCAWQRFATGLYHPLGLRVVDGKIVVLETGQLTRLHDTNNDGEADFYECITNAWHTGGGEHAYDTCLETDPAGNFTFFKTGDTHTPHGGCLLRAAKDGSKVEVFATGFRHPIGMGMSPSGILTGADQEGNWVPATRIDQYRPGGFYGDSRAHHRETPPATFDVPICWVPREVDNSAGGQVWVPPGSWGALGGLPLHLSYGRCRAFVLLRQELPGGLVQGGVADLGLQFLSGVCRARFRPADGHLYLCGLNGWQTAAKADGCLQRVRYLGTPPDVPVKLVAGGNTLRLTFARPLDPKSASDPANWRAAAWDYRWSGEYGSKRWRPSDPAQEGQDDVPVRGVTLEDGGRTAVLAFDALRPVMQMQVAYRVTAAGGALVVGSAFLTVHPTGAK